MNRLMITLIAALFVTVLGGLVPVLSQDMGGKEEPAEKDPMAAYMELHKPGPQHKWLAEGTGEWTIEGKAWQMGAPGEMTEMPVKGSAKSKMLYERYVLEELALEMGTGDKAMKMNMTGFIGYDNANKEYQSLYVGDMGTGMQLFKGQYDEEKKVMTLSAEWVDKGMGGIKVKSRFHILHKSNDECVMQIFATYGDAPEYKEVECTYKRKK